MGRDVLDKLGRYEFNGCFIEYTASGEFINYAWGLIGFEVDGSGTLDPAEFLKMIETQRLEGYIKVTERPISEGSDACGQSLNDWLNGVTR